MLVLYVVGGMAVIAIIAALVAFLEDHYSERYNYSIYKWPVLIILFFTFVLFTAFWMGMDGYVSSDNMLAAVVIGSILWIAVLVYNISKTSILEGIIVTVFQSVLAIMIVFVLLMVIVEYNGRNKRTG